MFVGSLEQWGQRCPHHADVGSSRGIRPRDLNDAVRAGHLQSNVNEVERQGVVQHVREAAHNAFCAQARPDGRQRGKGN